MNADKRYHTRSIWNQGRYRDPAHDFRFRYNDDADDAGYRGVLAQEKPDARQYPHHQYQPNGDDKLLQMSNLLAMKEFSAFITGV